MSQQKRELRLITHLPDIIILFAAFFLTNLMTFSFSYQFPNYSWPRYLFWLFFSLGVIGFILMELKTKSLLMDFFKLLRQQRILALFVLFSFFSIFWSKYTEASIAEFSMTACATILAIYLVIRYPMNDFFNFVLYFAYFCVIESYLFIVFLPHFGLFDNPQYTGVWRGLFWHKNHLGIIMAFFSSVFLLKIFLSQKRWWLVFANFVFFIGSVFLLINSHSATGILIFISLNTILLLIIVWVNIRSRLKLVHYLFIIGASAILVFVVIYKFQFLLGLFGREVTLTGRIPLWKNLLMYVWSSNPILGSGFGAIWNIDSFRIDMMKLNGWSYTPFFSDNGFLDILLNLGLLGLVLFLVFFFQTGFRVIRKFMDQPHIQNIFPIIVYLFLLLSNIAYSYFFEIEQFSWLLLVFISLNCYVSNNKDKIPTLAFT